MQAKDRKEMFKKTFDSVAKGYDNPALRFFSDCVPHLASYLDFKGNETVLDVATGTGNTALGLALHLPEGRVCGIDFSNGMLAKAQEKQSATGIKNVKFVEMDMQAIEFPDGYFNMAVSSFGIFFVEDMTGQLAYMATKVKPGGKVAATTFYRNLFAPQAEMFLDRIERCGVEVPPMTWKRTNTQSKCRAIFQAAGLVDVVTRQKKLGYYLPRPEQWWDILWNAGYRGLISQLSEDEMARFKHAHLAEVKALAGEQGLWLDIEVIYTIGTNAFGL